MTRLRPLLWEAFAVGFGLLNLLIYAGYAILDGSIFRRQTDKAQQALAKARSKLWSLKGQFDHHFFTLKDGTKLHYISSDPTKEAKGNLVVFLHGFPDSCFLWHSYFRVHRLKENSILVSVDIPGYGGSDSLSEYGPEEVLEAITAFILGMRDSHLSSEGRVLLVSHDWGSAIAFRLASEAPQLADRFIMCNSLLVSHILIFPGTAYVQALYTYPQSWVHLPCGPDGSKL